MKTKVLALVLSLTMLLSVAVSAATYTDVPESHDRYQAINTLSGMDIITGFPDGSFKPDEAVTRAQMAALITRMFNLSGSVANEQPFSDVAVDYWAVSNIVAAKNMKIINGFPDGTFKPEESVTYEQAVKMIVCALNYGSAAEFLGGYPAGYITQASKLNILRNAGYAYSSPAPRGIIAQLLYNSLEVEMLVPKVNADGTVDFVKPEEGGNTALEQFQKTKALNAVTVVRTPKVNLEPEASETRSINDDEIIVKNSNGDYLRLKVGSVSDPFRFIGQVVNLSYKEDPAVSDDKTLVSINLNGSVRKYENIKLSDIESISDSSITYYKDAEHENEDVLKLNGTKTVIYNERYHENGLEQLNTDLFEVENNIHSEGVISVYVSSNATLIKVKSYKTYMVTGLDVQRGIIKVKNADDIEIPYKEVHEVETVVKRGAFDFATGAVSSKATNSTFGAISRNALISVAYNNQDTSNAYYEIIVSTTTKTGTVSESSTDDATGRLTVKIGDSQTYLLSADLKRYGQENTVNGETSAKFFIDAFSQIGYVDNVKTSDTRLGIPVGTKNTGDGFDDEIQIRIYNVANNSVDEYDVASDVDTSVLREDGELKTDTIFLYTIKNGKIDTLAPIAEGDTTKTELENQNTYIGADSYVELADNGIKKISATKIEYPDGDFQYRSNVDKIIQIAEEGETGVTPKTVTMTTNTPYTGKVYTLYNKSGNYNIHYVLIRAYKGLALDSPTYIVDSVSGITPGADGNIVTLKVYPFTGNSSSGNGGGKTSVVLTASVHNALNLQKGDVFSYYKTETPKGVDINDDDCVFVLARAEQIAKGTQYPDAAYLEEDVDSFRFWGIKSNQSTLVAPSTTTVHAYYAGVAMEVVIDDESKTYELRMAKDTDGLPVMPEDDILSDLADNVGDDAYSYLYNVASLTNIYVYDALATLDSEKLIQVKDKDIARSYLTNLQTVEEGRGSYDTVVVKAYNSNTDAANTLYNLYIIKDAR